jgi:hypothetical protein
VASEDTTYRTSPETHDSRGTKQVTYKGHPLYFFTRDEDRGDTYGQGSTSFGAGWYVLKPTGKKVVDEGDATTAVAMIPNLDPDLLSGGRDHT